MNINDRVKAYNKIYEDVWKEIYEELSKLNSSEIKNVGGISIYYYLVKPSMNVLKKVNNKIKKIKENK